MKKLSMAIVMIVSLAIVAAAAYAVLAFDGGEAEGDNENQQPDQTEPSKTVISPVETDNRGTTLSVKYPGQGVGGYTYETDHTYTFDLTVSSNGWAGKTNIMLFAERSDGGIDTGCMHASVNGNAISTVKNYVEPENILSASIRNTALDSGENIQIPVDISFSRIGDFTLTFQAFDDKGNPVSAPLRCSGLNVPADGSISLSVKEKSVSGGETVIKAEVVNNTNVRVTVGTSDFYITNGSDSIRAVQSEPDSRTLNFRGDAGGNDKMEIILHFDYSGSLSGYRLEYRGAYAAESAALS